MKIRCQVVKGPAVGRAYEFAEPGTLLIGRSSEADVQLARDPAVSRHHCLIECAPPLCNVRDLHSANGTFVNDDRCTSEVRELRSGDRVRIGGTVLEVAVQGDERESTIALGGALVCERCGRPLEPGRPGAATGPPLCPRCTEVAAKLTVPGYAVVKKIAEGGMGAVYLARSEKGQPVAIKVVKPQFARNEDVVKRFRREAFHGAQVDHPNAVRVLGEGEVSGQPYFVMEYVNGPDLKKLVQSKGGHLALDEAVPIFLQLLDVVEHAHRKNLVHRDIKPQNALLAAPLPKPLVKLADFGLMKSLVANGLSSISRTGQAEGTPDYMAPEQLRNAKGVGPPADVYSLAGTLFFLLSGQAPLVPEANFVLTVLDGKVRNLRGINEDVPEGIEFVLRKSLAKKPEERYADVAALRRAINAAVEASR